VGILRLGPRAFEREQLLVMAVVAAADPVADPVAAMERVHAAVAEGADIVEVGGDAAFVAAVREAYPELVIGVSTGRAEVARETCEAGAGLFTGGGPFDVAAEFGVGVVCPLVSAARAVQAGVEPERIVVGAPGAGGLEELVATGWPVLVALSDPATTAVAAWLGARVFRVDRVRETRRVLRMVSAIRGDIPPARAVRGLA
jgi:dihydropteroate synthase